MSLQRFLLGLGLLSLILFAFKFSTNPVNKAFAVGEVIGTILTGLFVGSIIGAVKSKNKGTEKYSYDVRQFSLYSAVIVGAIFIAQHFINTNSLSENELLNLSKGIEEGCFSTSKKSQTSSQLSDSQLREYCSCVASLLSKEYTKEDFKFIETNKSLPNALQKKSQEFSKQCAQQLNQK